MECLRHASPSEMVVPLFIGVCNNRSVQHIFLTGLLAKIQAVFGVRMSLHFKSVCRLIHSYTGRYDMHDVLPEYGTNLLTARRPVCSAHVQWDAVFPP